MFVSIGIIIGILLRLVTSLGGLRIDGLIMMGLGISPLDTYINVGILIGYWSLRGLGLIGQTFIPISNGMLSERVGNEIQDYIKRGEGPALLKYSIDTYTFINKVMSLGMIVVSLSGGLEVLKTNSGLILMISPMVAGLLGCAYIETTYKHLRGKVIGGMILMSIIGLIIMKGGMGSFSTYILFVMIYGVNSIGKGMTGKLPKQDWKHWDVAINGISNEAFFGALMSNVLIGLPSSLIMHMFYKGNKRVGALEEYLGDVSCESFNGLFGIIFWLLMGSSKSVEADTLTKMTGLDGMTHSGVIIGIFIMNLVGTLVIEWLGKDLGKGYIWLIKNLPLKLVNMMVSGCILMSPLLLGMNLWMYLIGICACCLIEGYYIKSRIDGVTKSSVIMFLPILNNLL